MGAFSFFLISNTNSWLWWYLRWIMLIMLVSNSIIFRFSFFRSDFWRLQSIFNCGQVTHLRVVTVSGLVVEHVKKWLGPAFLAIVGGGGGCGRRSRWLRLAQHVTGVHQWSHILGVAKGRDSRVPGVDRVKDRPLPVRVLVDDRKEYFGQVVTVGVSYVRTQDLVPPITLESRLKIIYFLLEKSLKIQRAQYGMFQRNGKIFKLLIKK